MWKIIKGNSRGDTNTGSYSRTYGCTGYIHTASHIYTSPKLIGVKTSTAKFVYLTNSTKGEIREIYLRAAGGEEWGKNLVPAEATIKDAEQVQMYYTPDSARDAIYDMKIVD